MREGLETADNSLRNLESETSNIEEQMQKIDEALKAVENAIKRADTREDVEISASLQDNLKNKQVEYEKQVEAKRQIASVLGQIATEIGQLESQNNQSKQEVSQLAALGENVSEGLTLIQERQGMLQSLKQRHERLSARLSQTGPMRESETRSECKIPGFTHVAVSDLPDPDEVNSPADFDHHITWENAKSAALMLPQIQQEIAAGKTGDDFAMEDSAAGLDWGQGKKRVYDLFYGTNEPIRLDKQGDSYSIVSGRHRVYAAKALGLETIPAQVVEIS